jgi:NitT/TauT family transport system permease protein
MTTAVAVPERRWAWLTRGRLSDRAFRLVMLPVVFAAIYGLWEGYRAVWIATGWTRPFVVDRTSMPHLYDIVHQLFVPARVNGPLLITILWHAALFTAKEAAVGFAIGASFGFALGVVLAHSRLLQRGFLPWIVASQTIPLIAIAPMVVVGLGNYNVPPWLRVAVIAAFLTFFPVTVNTLRGLTSVEPTSLELMHTYAAGRWAVLWKVRVPTALPYIFTALKVAATASVVGAIIGEAPSSIPNGLGGAIINFNQYYVLAPESLWATNLIAAALGITFFLFIVLAEKIVVRRAPGHAA